MSVLFEAASINGMQLENRLVRSATWVGMASARGEATDDLTRVLCDLADGQVGLIVCGHAYVRPEGQAGVRQLGIHTDDLVEGLRRMVDAVHQHGGTIVAQLAHAGLFADTKLTGQPAWAFSLPEKYRERACRIMSADDISVMVDAFSIAAGRARQAGFDGVQIHAAHGYLLSQSLAPYFNRRDDQYGGSLQNRARTLLQVIGRVRAEVGDDYPVLVKMNSEDFFEGGLTREDALRVGEMLQGAGIDAMELSGGTRESGKLIPSRVGIKTPEQEAYFQDAAREHKKRLRMPIILVGGVRSFEVAERQVADEVCDLVAMCRPFIREPALAARWAAGDRTRARCISDNQCYKPARAGEGIHCVVERREQQKS